MNFMPQKYTFPINFNLKNYTFPINHHLKHKIVIYRFVLPAKSRHGK